MVQKPEKLDGRTQPATGWLSSFPPHRRHLFLAGGSILLVYAAGVTGRWWPTPDSALYLGLARSLANGEGLRFNGEVHGLVTPGLPLILAGIRVLFGDGFWAPNLFIALCALGTLALTYRVIARFSDRRIALAVTVCTAFSYTFFYNGHRILTDMPFALLFWASLYASIRSLEENLIWLVPAGLFAAAGFFIRAPGLAVLGPLAVGLTLDRSLSSKPAKRLLVGGAIIVAVGIAAMTLYLPAYVVQHNAPEYLSIAIQKGLVPPLAYLHRLGRVPMQMSVALSEMLTSQEEFLPVGLAGLLLVIAGAVNLWRKGSRLIPALVILYPVGLGIFAGPAAVKSRYLLPVHALLLFALIEGICWSMSRFAKLTSRALKPRFLSTALILFTALVVAANAPWLLRNAFYYSYLSHTQRYYHAIRYGKYADLFPVAEILRNNCPQDALIYTGGSEVRLIPFVSDRRITPFPDVPHQNAADADVIVDFALSNQQIAFIVFNLGTGTDAFRQRIVSALNDSSEMQLVYSGKHYVVYQRTQAVRFDVTTSPAHVKKVIDFTNEAFSAYAADRETWLLAKKR